MKKKFLSLFFMLICSHSIAQDLILLGAGKLNLEKYQYITLSVSDDGKNIDGYVYDYKENSRFPTYYGEIDCKLNLNGEIVCGSEFYDRSLEYQKKGVESLKYCNLNKDFNNFIFHQGKGGYSVLESYETDEIWVVETNSCNLKKVIPLDYSKSNNGFGFDMGRYLGLMSNKVVFYFTTKEYPHDWYGIAEFDIEKEKLHVISSGNVRLDFGIADVSEKNLAIVETEREEINGDFFNYEKVCIYFEDSNYEFHDHFCRKLTPKNERGDSVSVESVSLSRNGKYLVLSYLDESNLFNIDIYEIR